MAWARRGLVPAVPSALHGPVGSGARGRQPALAVAPARPPDRRVGVGRALRPRRDRRERVSRAAGRASPQGLTTRRVGAGVPGLRSSRARMPPDPATLSGEAAEAPRGDRIGTSRVVLENDALRPGLPGLDAGAFTVPGATRRTP